MLLDVEDDGDGERRVDVRNSERVWAVFPS